MPVYRKTAKGREEIESRIHGLNASRRRLLILVDGQRRRDELRSMLLLPDFEAALSALHDEAFIELPSSPVAKPEVFSPEDEGIVAIAREVIIETSRKYAGLHGEEIVRLAQMARSRELMLRCIARWKLVMQESRAGAELATAHFDQVRLLLHRVVFA